jgi:hypothetical protein
MLLHFNYFQKIFVIVNVFKIHFGDCLMYAESLKSEKFFYFCDRYKSNQIKASLIIETEKYDTV